MLDQLRNKEPKEAPKERRNVNCWSIGIKNLSKATILENEIFRSLEVVLPAYMK